jgi:hypothetical protein
MTLEVSFTILEHIYCTGVTHDNHHILIVQATEFSQTHPFFTENILTISKHLKRLVELKKD